MSDRPDFVARVTQVADEDRGLLARLAKEDGPTIGSTWTDEEIAWLDQLPIGHRAPLQEEPFSCIDIARRADGFYVEYEATGSKDGPFADARALVAHLERDPIKERDQTIADLRVQIATAEKERDEARQWVRELVEATDCRQDVGILIGATVLDNAIRALVTWRMEELARG